MKFQCDFTYKARGLRGHCVDSPQRRTWILHEGAAATARECHGLGSHDLRNSRTSRETIFQSIGKVGSFSTVGTDSARFGKPLLIKCCKLFAKCWPDVSQMLGKFWQFLAILTDVTVKYFKIGKRFAQMCCLLPTVAEKARALTL